MEDVTLADVRDGGARRSPATIDQVPPMVSAVKVGGRGCTSWPARASRSNAPARPVTVDRFDVHARR